jgi:hypothetical protein
MLEDIDGSLIIGRDLGIQTVEAFLPGDVRQFVDQLRGESPVPECGIHHDAHATQMPPPPFLSAVQ